MRPEMLPVHPAPDGAEAEEPQTTLAGEDLVSQAAPSGESAAACGPGRPQS